MDWVPRFVQYGNGNIKVPIIEEVRDHPLKQVASNSVDGPAGVRRGTLQSTSTSSSTRTPTPVQTPAQSASDFIDPLTSQSSLDGTDPLSQFAHEEMDPLTKMATDEWDYSENVIDMSRKAKNLNAHLLEQWRNRRTGILKRYTTSGGLTMSAGKYVPLFRPENQLPEKVKNRMEQLDDIEDDSSKLSSEVLTQQKYTARLEQLNNDLVQAWNSDQRVKALKIAIQAAKLLSDTSVMEFYPSKFVLVTDILDNFGQLVYNRLKMKSVIPKPGAKFGKPLPENFTPDMVPENARETCQNWFYKIASIRELVPRLYVELAIIKSYRFLKNSDITGTLFRITRMIHGIGDPLVAVYARCYLCRVGLAVDQVTDLSFVKENFETFLSDYGHYFSDDYLEKKIWNELAPQKIYYHEYTNLYLPAVEWITQIVFSTSSDDYAKDIYMKCCTKSNSALLLAVLLKSFKPVYIASNWYTFASWISQLTDESDSKLNLSYPTYKLYRILGEHILKEDPLDGSKYFRNPFFDERLIYMLGDLRQPKPASEILNIAEVWIQITINKCPSYLGRWLDTIGNIMKGIPAHSEDELYCTQIYTQVQTIIEKLVANLHEIQSFSLINKIVPIIDLIHKECIKVEVCKTVIEGYSAQTGPITDPVMIDNIMSLMRTLHDSVSTNTVEDEKRQISILICSLIQRVDYGRDFEKQLNFYVEARAAFANLDSVHMQLVQCVNRLAVDTRKIVRGYHTRRTSSFVRACIAFCFITIPSLSSVRTRLQLYLLSGQVALSNQCLEQADACFKAALSLVPEMPKTIDIDGRQKSSEPYLLAYLSSFLSTLLVVPDSPEHGVLYLMRGLLNAAQRWFDDNSNAKWEFYLRVLDLLSTVVQETYPYHVDKVDSNDTFYGSDPKFINEVNKISTKIFTEIVNRITQLGLNDQREKQCNLAFDLYIRMIMRADVSQTPMAHLVTNLWIKSLKYDFIDKKFRSRTVEYFMNENRSPEVQQFVGEYVLQ